MMGKGDRRNKAKLPSLAPVVTQAAHPRDRRGKHKPAPDASQIALDARCRRFGITPTQDARQALSAAHSGSDIGLVMQRLVMDQREVHAIWGVWQAWCSAESTYLARIIGISAGPKGASIAAISERIETDKGHTIDARTSDQKDADAVENYMKWQGDLGHLSATQTSILHSARRGDGKPLWVDTIPTPTGIATLNSLRALRDVVED